MGNQHPRFAAWVNPAGAPIGMLADFLAAVMNPSAAGGDHAAIYLEHCVVRWLMELIDFPVEGSAGILVGGGSVASLYCLAVARQWAAENRWLEYAHRRITGEPSTTRALHLGRGT